MTQDKAKPPEKLPQEFASLLQGLAKALKSENVREIDRIMKDFESQLVGSEKNDNLHQVSNCVLIGEYARAAEILDGLLGNTA
jgi:hypothetical protein